MSPPKISVLIPTYNYARFLQEAIESVLAQDWPDFELLIVDDASADNTADVVRPFCARDPRVRLSVNPDNLGMVNNWNHCLALARGEYIKFLFADDKLSDPRALGKMIALLRNHPTATLAASARTILDEKSNVTDLWQPLPAGCHNGRKIIASCLKDGGNLVGEPSAVLFRKADAQRGFNTAYRQWVDMEMWFHLLERGDLAYTGEPLCCFRRHSMQQTAVNRSTGVADREYLEILRAYLDSAWFSRELFFYLHYYLLRDDCRARWTMADMAELERRLASRLGMGWYFLYWCKHKLTQPFKNLARSIRKRRRRNGLPKPAILPNP